MTQLTYSEASPQGEYHWQFTLLSARILRVRCCLATHPVAATPELVLLPQLPHFDAGQRGDDTLCSDMLRVRRLDKAGAWQIHADSQLLLTLTGTELFPAANTSDGLTVRQRFDEAAPGALYGLGQYPDGVLNWRGKTQVICQSNKGIAAPLLLSTAGFGVLWNTPARSEFNSDEGGFSFTADAGSELDFFVLWGPDFDAIHSGYQQLTGHAPLFGRWAYGYWQSRERYIDAAEIVAVARKYRELNIPIDNLVQDWKYWGELGWSAMQFDVAQFGDGQAMIDTLHELNYKLMISIWPVVGEGSAVFNELKHAGHLFETPHWAQGHIYDAFSAEAREIYWKHLQCGLWDLGVDAFWMDGTEPEFVSAQVPQDGVDACLAQRDTAAGSWRRVLNAYSLVTTGGVYQKQRALGEEKRVFTLSRSSFLGQQRYAAACWSGDISASWQVLHQQIAAGLNLCATGLPYWTTDIGGFFTTGFGASYPEGVDDDAYKELYVRWFQFGTFCPLFRSHGANTPREIYQFGEPGDWAFDSLLKFDKLRYRLLPYIYSLAWQVTRQHRSIMRLLAFDFPEQPLLHDVSDQYLFGREFLVCPVTQAMFHQQTQQHELVQAQWQQSLFSDDALSRHVATQRVSELDGNWAGGPPAGLPLAGYSVRWQATIVPEHSGIHQWLVHANDGVVMRINDQSVIDQWQVSAARNIKVESLLEAGQEYRIELEYAHWRGSSKVSLSWAHPGQQFEPTALAAAKRELILPSGCDWIDYWSKQVFAGGQRITAATPIDQIPLYLRAGSIIPCGPDVQYHNEKPCDPLEIEIYAGADGSFVLYEDEGDSYRYEQGAFSEIAFTWTEELQRLDVSIRHGEFPGMLSTRTFVLRLIADGVSRERTIEYNGEPISIDFPSS